MPRTPRSFVKTTYFHIMTQGINREYIFKKTEDIKYYIKRMYSLKEKYDIEILAYCIMNNHAHILIKTETIENI